MGAMTADLAGMDGIVNGSQVRSDSGAEIWGQVPLWALQSYHLRLKPLSGGEGNFTMDFSHYTRVCPELQKELTSAHKPVEDE